MPLTTSLPGGGRQVDKKGTFCTLLPALPSPEKAITSILREFDEGVTLEYPQVSSGALNNCHGDWYEWLIAMAAWNYSAVNPGSYLLLKMPNIRQFDCARLYDEDLFGCIVDLREKVERATSVQLISSNPDFVIIDPGLVPLRSGFLTPYSVNTPSNLEALDSAYNNFIGRCSFEAIIGYLSVKVSFRPDRRLQIPHEGSLMKALYTHLQTRKWIINPPGIKYYAVAATVGDPDRNALKTVATHSITTVSSIPQSAVDEVYQVNSINDALSVFRAILTP